MKQACGCALVALCALTPGFAVPKTRAAKLYNQIPLGFEANQGQTDHQVKFLARAPGYTLFLTGDGATLAFKNQSLRMSVLGGASHARVFGTDPLPGKANYFIGNDPARWHSGVPTYARVKYEGIYPGIDLVYYGEQRQLEYDFVVAPGADPASIALRLEGATARLDKDGNLLVGEARFHKPVVYQEGAAGKTFVDGRYLLHGQRVAFALAKYDRSKPLVIDPVLSYSTYLGGTGEEIGVGIAVDSAVDAYAFGYTGSADFPVTSGTYQPTCKQTPSGQCSGDAFITKFSPDGKTLVYSTFLGGSAGDIANTFGGIAVDSSGNAYVTAFTDSTDFPVTAGAFQPSCTCLKTTAYAWARSSSPS